MGRRSIRTKSGRLRAGERRRLLRKAALKPGEVIILDRSRRAHRGVRQGGAFQVELVANTQLGVDSDVRKLLHPLRVDLASHYSDQVIDGKRPDGKGDTPALKTETLERNPGRPDEFGVLSGYMALRWLLFKIRGGPLKASTRIKPNGADGRAITINKWLGRGIDLQSVDGAAADVIRDRVQAHLPQVTAANGVATPRRVPRNGGELPRFRK